MILSGRNFSMGRRHRLGLATMALLVGYQFAMSDGLQADPLPGIVEKIKASVVGVGTFQAIRQPRAEVLGTGFAVADGSHIITNYHVIDGKQDLAEKKYLIVMVGRGQKIEERPAEVVKVDAMHDLALLSITDAPLTPVRLGNRSRLVGEGTTVAMTGYPLGPVLGLYSVTHQGIISSISPNLIPQPTARNLDPAMVRASRFEAYMLDITAYPGNSGSPVYIADSGQVIGVLNSTFVKGTKESILTNPSGISYAIPVEYVYRLIRAAGLNR